MAHHHLCPQRHGRHRHPRRRAFQPRGTQDPGAIAVTDQPFRFAQKVGPGSVPDQFVGDIGFASYSTSEGARRACPSRRSLGPVSRAPNSYSHALLTGALRDDWFGLRLCLPALTSDGKSPRRRHPSQTREEREAMTDTFRPTPDGLSRRSLLGRGAAVGAGITLTGAFGTILGWTRAWLAATRPSLRSAAWLRSADRRPGRPAGAAGGLLLCPGRRVRSDHAGVR